MPITRCDDLDLALECKCARFEVRIPNISYGLYFTRELESAFKKANQIPRWDILGKLKYLKYNPLSCDTYFLKVLLTEN